MDRLDQLLEEARLPEPEDDGFTGRVMAAVAADDTPRLSNVRRLITRPTVLAAAAVLVTGGALAAAVRTTQAPERDARSPKSLAQDKEAAARPSTGPATVTASEAPVAPVTTTDESDETSRKYRRGDVEWGYTSKHNAYVVDHRTGLRLETETYRNSFATDVPTKVTLTLRNTGEHPVGIYASNGCALSVAAFQPDANDQSKMGSRVPTGPTDKQGSKCAGGESAQGQPEKFVLSPGEAKSADASIVLDKTGEWTVIGMCECYQVSPDDAEDGQDPLGDIPDLLLAQVGDDGQRGEEWRLFTPPIRVEAS